VVRTVLAVVTEIYAIIVMRSIEKEPPPPRLVDDHTAGVIAAIEDHAPQRNDRKEAS
jgi:hypothetical protein